MRIIRTGISRTVILVGRYAVKVPSFRGHMPGGIRGRMAGFAYGMLHNQSEAIWSGFEPWDGLVAPVLHSWLGGLINVYPRCEPLDVPDDDTGRATLPLLEPDPGRCEGRQLRAAGRPDRTRRLLHVDLTGQRSRGDRLAPLLPLLRCCSSG